MSHRISDDAAEASFLHNSADEISANQTFEFLTKVANFYASSKYPFLPSDCLSLSEIAKNSPKIFFRKRGEVQKACSRCKRPFVLLQSCALRKRYDAKNLALCQRQLLKFRKWALKKLSKSCKLVDRLELKGHPSTAKQLALYCKVCKTKNALGGKNAEKKLKMALRTQKSIDDLAVEPITSSKKRNRHRRTPNAGLFLLSSPATPLGSPAAFGAKPVFDTPKCPLDLLKSRLLLTQRTTSTPKLPNSPGFGQKPSGLAAFLESIKR